MTNSEQSVLDTIAELEAEENLDDITELVRWQLEKGVERGDHRAEFYQPSNEAFEYVRAVAPAVVAQVNAAFETLRAAFVAYGEAVREEIATSAPNLPGFSHRSR